MQFAADVVKERRDALAGASVAIQARIGFVSMGVPSGRALQLPQGRLRSANPGEARYAPLSFLADSVLETTVAGRLCSPGSEGWEAQAHGQLRLGELGRDLCLAAALGSADGAPMSCPAVAWVTELAPLPGSSASRPMQPSGAPPGRSEPMNAAAISGLSEWAARLADADLSRIAIGVDRVLRSLWEPEPTESLIDAVIAWESMLGTRAETAFRVTAALAKLCEDDIDRRLSARKELAAVYNARSRLVHGDPVDGQILDHRARAVATALEAMRRLVRDRPDLLMLAKSSARADRLLLA